MRPHSRGAALVLGLILLVAMCLLALTTTSGAALQARMSANWENRSLAFSHAALADARARGWISSRPGSDRGPGCGPNVIQPHGVSGQNVLPSHPEHQSKSWWETHATQFSRHPEMGTDLLLDAGMPADIYWLAEEIHCQPATASRPFLIAWYRILSRAGGKLPGSIVITESIVARPWGAGITAGAFPGPGSLAVFCNQFGSNVPCGRKTWRQRR